MREPAGLPDDLWSVRRTRIVAGVLALAFAVIVGRAAQIAMTAPDAETFAASGAEGVRRADIVDRNGDLLATSLPVWSLAADPGAVWDPAEVAEAVGGVLPDVNVADLTTRLSDQSRKFVWVQRGLTPRQRQAVFALGLEGLHFEQEMRRVYPGGKLAGHLLGFTNVDGAVRAVASWPALDPNHAGSASEDVRTNRALTSVYELGSIFKPLTVAAALDAGVVSPAETFDVSKPVKIGSTSVRDTHAMTNASAVTLTDILAYSSNIGAIEIGRRLGVDGQRELLERAGLMTRPAYDGPQSAAPLTPSQWNDVTAATVSYGHGIAVSPLAFTMAFVPFANGGEYVPPAFLEPAGAEDADRRPVMTAETSRVVLDMMRQTVLTGTGGNAEAAGYEVAGKTGTAEKPVAGGYDPDRNVTSFAAVFPASRPQFVVLIVLDEARPKSGEAHTAAYTAATVAGGVIARAAPLLDVHPVIGEAGVTDRPGRQAPPQERTL
jgi:cell division protein FtsI (penicillin-binding protein 3)